MSNLKILKTRLGSVKNIRKITKSMRMVSAAKYSKAERELQKVKPIGRGAQHFYKVTEIELPKDETKKTLIIAISSDRGLCGAIHSSVARFIRTELKKDSTSKLVCVGEKCRAILVEPWRKNIVLSASEIGRTPPTFLDAAEIANAIKDSVTYDKIIIVYNHFNSVVSYTTSTLIHFAMHIVEVSPKVISYDEIDTDVLESYLEFLLALLIYYAMKQNTTSEQSARMTAMDNATKNANDMITKLSVIYNRTRQAMITKELIEIISGAAATEGK